jgi:hypothetical protein
MVFRLPNSSQRLAVIGRTGSGKTQAAVWHLSRQDFTKMPWIVFNFKGDKLIDELPGTFDLEVGDKIPKHPGIYIVRPMVFDKDDKEKLDEFLMRAWTKEHVGLYVDEGYMASGLKWFRVCLTQGRSKNIPMIVLAQRPVWLDRFVWSESDFYQAFTIHTGSDRKIVDEYIPGYSKVELPEFYSVWHDVGQGETIALAPVPDRATLLQSFRDRMPIRRRAI